MWLNLTSQREGHLCFAKKDLYKQRDGIDLGLYHSFRLLSVVRLHVQVKSLKLGHEVDHEQGVNGSNLEDPGHSTNIQYSGIRSDAASARRHRLYFLAVLE